MKGPSSRSKLLNSLYFFLFADKVWSLSFHADKPVSALLLDHASSISALKKGLDGNLLSIEPYCNDVFFLRYAMDDEDIVDATSKMQEALEWRGGKGKSICDAAREAVTRATTSGAWDNNPVLEAAPHSSTISTFLASNCLTTTTTMGDLIYCVRAGKIDDVALMASLSKNTDKLTDFFLYAKEVNFIVANQRSMATNRLVSVITVNDLSGVKLIGGDSSFRTALSGSSKLATKLYPNNLSGPTLLLNLPPLLNALVSLFRPLFPPQVKARLRFEQGPLSDVQALAEVSYGGAKRDAFIQEISNLVYE